MSCLTDIILYYYITSELVSTTPNTHRQASAIVCLDSDDSLAEGEEPKEENEEAEQKEENKEERHEEDLLGLS